MVVLCIIPVLGRLRQKNHLKFKRSKNKQKLFVAGKSKQLLGKTKTAGGVTKVARFELRPRGLS